MPAHAADPAVDPSNGLHVLVIEDQHDIAANIWDFLERRGYRVDHCADGDAGAPPRIRSGSARRAAEIASLSLALGGPPRPGASAVPTASRAPDRASAIVTYDRVMMTTVAHLRALL